jgi:hypothetical protein
MAMADQRGGAADQEEKEKEKMQGKQDQAFTIRYAHLLPLPL